MMTENTIPGITNADSKKIKPHITTLPDLSQLSRVSTVRDGQIQGQIYFFF